MASTGPTPSLPRHARLPINRCNLPAVILGSLTFQRHPVALELDGVAALHRRLFRQLDATASAAQRALLFQSHMDAVFSLAHPEQAGYREGASRNRAKASYLRMLRGWSFDADGMEGAVLKGWVESRFGLLPRHHGGAIRDPSDPTYRHFLELRTRGLYGTNALEAQLDLLYAYAQYELARGHPGATHLSLYRGVNRVETHEFAWADATQRVMLFNNLTSFSANRERADEFGDAILEVRMPLAKIFFYQQLLPGLLQGEDEYAVIGGMYEVNL